MIAKSPSAMNKSRVLMAISSLMITACIRAETPLLNATQKNVLGAPISLALNGFNYTDEYIDQFVVAGSAGTNIFVSSLTSGGGKTACCAIWRPGTPLPLPIRVEWTRDRKRWCEKTVYLLGPVPEEPTALGVHFMPDGEVIVEITEGYPKLKLRLENYDDGHRKESGNLVHDEHTARCRDGR